MFLNQQDVVTTEKYLSFQVSRVRLAAPFGPQVQPLVITGSWNTETNSLCLWKFKPSSEYFLNCSTLKSDFGIPHILADSMDDPRLVCSTVHSGDVQQLRFHDQTQLTFTGSSMGFVTIFQLQVPESSQDLFRFSEIGRWAEFGDNLNPLDAAISDINISKDASKVYVGDDFGRLIVLDTETLSEKEKINVQGRGFDVTSINAIETVDDACIATCNQVGHLNVWDLRTPYKSNLPQRRIIPMGEPRPLVSLSQHPGQPHILAVGGINNSQRKVTSSSYIWDLRAEQYPLSELNCPGTAVWEIKFHPTQPQQLYLATEEAGLIRVQSASSSESWSYMQGSRRKLSAICATQTSTSCCNVTTFDLRGGLIVCARDNCVLQATQDSSISTFSCE